MPTRSSLFPRVRRLLRREPAREDAPDAAPPAVAETPAEPRAPSTGQSVDAGQLELLDAEARYHRDRLALYRAREYAGKPTTTMRLRELERTAAAAEARLAHAHGRQKSRPPTQRADVEDGRSAPETSDQP